MATEDYSEFVPNVHFEQIPIKNLVSNQDYQRPLSRKHVDDAAKHFDLYQINPVKVSRRDGINYVFNGQHTIEIVAAVSGSRETPVWCMIYDDLEYTHEADIFANQMKYVKSLLPFEIFQANIEAGNNKQLLIKELVESYGLKLAGTANPGCICAIGTLEKIYDKYGYEMLSHVLTLLIATWEGDPQSLGSSVLMAMAKFLDAFGDTITDENFKERMSSYSIKEICRAAKDKRMGTLGYAETMLVYYNKRSRNPIGFEPLYSKKKKRPESFQENEVQDSKTNASGLFDLEEEEE